MKTTRSLTARTLAPAACLAFSTNAATLIDTDFNSEAVGTYGTQAGTDLPSSTTVGGLSVTSDTTNGSVVAVVGTADRAVQFTDNNANFVAPGAPHLTAPLAGVSSDPTGDNQLHIAFDYSYFDTTGSGNPLFQLLVNNNNATSASAGNRIAQLQINGNTGSVLYWSTANPPLDSGIDLVDSQDYRIELLIDLSSDTQDTYDLTITNLSSNTTALDLKDIDTRLPDSTPDVISFSGGANGGVAVGEAFAEIDNILVTANPVPEPASLALLATGGLLIASRRRR